jgi:hypothetical protein
MRMVLLRHELPDGTWHFDWMIEPAEGYGLVTFRVSARVDDPETTQFDAERIGEHRREYLEYEGAVSGGRGTVVRVAAGWVEGVSEWDGEIVVRGEMGGCAGVWTGRRGAESEGDVWRFVRG